MPFLVNLLLPLSFPTRKKYFGCVSDFIAEQLVTLRFVGGFLSGLEL